MKIPDGMKVTVGGVTYRGEIPDTLCPEFLKPQPPKAKATDEPARKG